MIDKAEIKELKKKLKLKLKEYEKDVHLVSIKDRVRKTT